VAASGKDTAKSVAKDGAAVGSADGGAVEDAPSVEMNLPKKEIIR